MDQQNRDPNKPGDSGTKESSTAAAPTKTEEQSTTQNVLSQTPDASHTEEVTPGAFGPFRYYINQKLRNTTVVLPHGEGPPWVVQELTVDGQLRIANPGGDGFALIPMDERYIPSMFKQLLGLQEG